MPEIRLVGGALDGLTLHWIGGGRGPSVVFLHGLGGFAESWRPTMEALAGRHTVLALDLPGFGRSAKPRGRYDLEFFAAAVHGFLDAMGIPQATLVGHSLGGAVAVACALRRPSRVDRLALLGALVPGFYRLSLPYRVAVLPALGEGLALARSKRLYKAALSRCFYTPGRAHVDFLVEHAWTERTCMAARLAFLRTLRHCRDDLVARAPAYRRAIVTLDLPVLFVHGRHDPVIPAAACRAAAAAFPRAEVRWLEACGHFPQLECPASVNDWLAAFAAERPAAR
ncbi:MAG TPA: alpha/beta fold hydrolase [Candidatus Binatia bacterium]|nr:alpha/beta fold hydrolase [Candidatus Binatia bacterium]